MLVPGSLVTPSSIANVLPATFMQVTVGSTISGLQGMVRAFTANIKGSSGVHSVFSCLVG